MVSGLKHRGQVAAASLLCVILAAQNARGDECQVQANLTSCTDDGIPCTSDLCRSGVCTHRYGRVIYVRPHCQTPVGGPSKGCNWLEGFETIQEALAATDDDSDTDQEIWVSVGVYRPVDVCTSTNCAHYGTCTSGSDERLNSFNLKNTVHIYGGFRATELVRAERPADPDPYTIDPLTDSVLTGDLNGDDPITTQGGVEL